MDMFLVIFATALSVHNSSGEINQRLAKCCLMGKKESAEVVAMGAVYNHALATERKFCINSYLRIRLLLSMWWTRPE